MSDHTLECNVCGFPKVPVRKGKGGTWSGKCPAADCGAQLLIKSPAGAARLDKRFSGEGTAAASDPGAELLKI